MAINAFPSKDIHRAASALRNAKALFITSGAGMGVDSGLPDFRGPEGFWKAYPPLQKLGIRFPEMSNPSWFDTDPRFAWGFFGHRYNLYSAATPHRGFGILLEWAKRMADGYFVFTSNVDGQFQKAGFDADRIVECHGTIHCHQCTDPLPHRNATAAADAAACIWPVPDGTTYDVDMDTLRMRGPLPHGPPGEERPLLARPNILMFGDWSWLADRTSDQERRFESFRNGIGAKNASSVVVEIGAGNAVPTVRYTSEALARASNSTLIRINPLEPELGGLDGDRHISLRMKGLEALESIDEALNCH